ncbi:hypothetical protein BDW72DRAFT_37854 [Aspergillus terricola var. indicus]
MVHLLRNSTVIRRVIHLSHCWQEGVSGLLVRYRMRPWLIFRLQYSRPFTFASSGIIPPLSSVIYVRMLTSGGCILLGRLTKLWDTEMLRSRREK